MPILDIHVECTGIELSCQLGLFAYVQVVICSREGPYFPFWCCSTSNLFSPPHTSFLPERLLLYAWQKVTCLPRCYLENPYVLRFGAINFFLCHSPSHLSLGIHFSVSLACYYPFLSWWTQLLLTVIWNHKFQSIHSYQDTWNSTL